MGISNSKTVIPIKNIKKPHKINKNSKKKKNKKNKKNKNKKNKKKKISKTLKLQVWDKHVGLKKGLTKCHICEIQIIYQMTFEEGHMIAESKGGATDINNLIPICSTCNKSQGTKEFTKFKKENCIKKNNCKLM